MPFLRNFLERIRKMKLKSTTRSAAQVLLTGVAWLFGANVASASESIVIDASEAVHAGELCDTGVAIATSGNQIKIRLSDAKSVLLPSEGDLATRGSCGIRIPVVVPRGYYLNKVTTRAQANVSKPRGTKASIVLRTAVFGYEGLVVQSELDDNVSVNGLVNTYKAFAGTAPLATEWRQQLCASNRSQNGLLAINLADVLQREDADDLVSVDFSGSSRGIDIWTELAPCSL
jgi:hypothetical protein